MLKHENSQSIAGIDARLAELEEEKKRLLTLREQLKQPSPLAPDSNAYSPGQKIAIFRSLFRGRTDIFANRWQNQQGRSVFFKTQALRFSTHGIPRFISCACIENGYLALPRGCLDDALALLKENNIEVKIDDKRELGTRLSGIKPVLTLKKNQQSAVKEMCRHDSGILHAPTAFGKTVTAIGMIAKRKVNTLILVHSRQPLDQWQERLHSFLPEVEIGVIRGGKKKPTKNEGGTSLIDKTHSNQFHLLVLKELRQI